MKTVSRQWEMLRLIPARPPGLTVADIHDRLEALEIFVTRRTVERDLNDLAEVLPLTTDDDRPARWQWFREEGFSFPRPNLAEAVSLVMVEQHLRHALPPGLIDCLAGRFSAARSVLEQAEGRGQAAWPDLFASVPPTLPTLAPEVDAAALAALQEALLTKHRLRAVYAGPDADPREMVLHPLGLVQAGPLGYVLATAWDYEDVRAYALHRFRSAEVLDEERLPLPGFDLRQHIDQGALQFGGGEEIQLRARLAPDLAARLRESPLSTDQHIEEKRGRWTLAATVRDSWQLQFWILSQGPAIRVTAPAGLRRRLAGLLREAADAYKA